MNSPLVRVNQHASGPFVRRCCFSARTELRKWIALATLARTAEDKPSELIRHSLVRARFCESVARLAKKGLEQSAFLTGLFSLLDALIDRPLEETLSEMCLAPEIAAVLRGESAGERSAGGAFTNWPGPTKSPIGSASKRSRCSFGYPTGSLSEAYCAAAGWAQQVMEPARGCPAGLNLDAKREPKRRLMPRPTRPSLRHAEDRRQCGCHWRRLADPSPASAFSKRSRKPSGSAVPPLSTMGSGRLDLGRLRELEKACFMPCTSDWIISS